MKALIPYLPHWRRDRHSCSLQHLAAYSLEWRPEQVPLSLMAHLYFLQSQQVAQDIRPFKLPSASVQPLRKLVHEEQRKETCE